jgi:hypothetical protein
MVEYCKICEYSKWCKLCLLNYLKTNWTSGNEKIDDFIQEMQLKINGPNDTILEWIPYNQCIDIEETSFTKTYLAIWKDGPLYYKNNKRDQNKKVALKYSQSTTIDEFLNKV